MDVAGAADPGVVGLRHERDRAAVQVRDLLGAVLVDHVVVGHPQRVGVAEVDLLLPRPRLALRALDRDARRLHPVADLADQALVVGRREDRVVEDVGHRRRQVAVVLGVRLGVALLQQVELELGADHRLEPRRPRPRDLRREHLPRRGDDRRAVLPGHVAEHERRSRQPRDPPQRVEVGLQVEVAVAALPARHRRTRAAGPSPCRTRAGSCSPRARARASRRRRSAPPRACPSSRPCMSVKAQTTVSIVPASTSAASSSSVSIGRVYAVRGARAGAPHEPNWPRRAPCRREGRRCLPASPRAPRARRRFPCAPGP